MERAGNSIAVVIAALNEEEGIGTTIEDIKDFLDDPYLLVVDGRSLDKTVEIAKSMGAHIVVQNGKGKGQALHQGIKELDSNIRYIVFVDADFTYPAMYLPQMIAMMEQNPNLGMVIGNRFNNHFDLKNAMANAFYAGNRLLAFAQHLLNGIKLHDPLSGLRVVRRSILQDWEPKSQGFDIEVEMNYRVEHQGYQIVEIPIRYRRRLGQKKLKLRHGFTILKRIVSESLA